jgi:hypothetical protein
MSARSCVVVLVVVAGCGDDAPAPYGVTDGSRLAARYWNAGHGARVFRTWFDRDLDIECHFELATDGRVRCVPPADSSARIGYVDPACTEPLLVAPMCGDAPRFARGAARTPTGCERGYAIPIHDVLGARISTSFYSRDGNGCVPDGAPEGYAVYGLGPEHAPADFVAADLEVTAPDARLSPYVYVADDGSRVADGIWDTERDAECGSLFGNGADLRCRPTEIALHYDFLYSDATCTTHAAIDLSVDRACHAPSAVWLDDSAFLEIGARIPSGEAHRTDSAGMCVPENGLDSEDTFWLEGPPIPNESFAPFVETLDGDGRVRAYRLTDADGRGLDVARSFFDTSSDERCEPRLYADGYRCHGWSTVASYGTYSDTNCLVPVIVAYQTPPRLAVSGHEQVDACDRVEFDRAYQVGAPVDQPSYYVKTETDCIARLRGTDELLFARGAETEVPAITR